MGVDNTTTPPVSGGGIDYMMIGLFVGFFIFLGVALIFLLKWGTMPKKKREAEKIRILSKLYDKLSNNFLTQGYLALIYSKLANLSVYKRSELKLLSTSYFLTSIGIGIGMTATGVILFKDALSILICVLFAILVSTIVVDKKIDGVYLKVLFALSRFLGSLRQEYMRFGSVVDAIVEAECLDIIKKPIDDIHAILTSTDGELKLQEFYEGTPFRVVQSLASVCFNINNQGDEKDAFGQSNFIQSLTLMSSDVNSEIQKITMMKKRFGFIEYLPFVPVFGMSIMQNVFTGIIPGTALVYNSSAGYLLRVFTILTAIASYTIISRINCNVPIKEDDRSTFILNLLEKKWIRKRVLAITPKNRKAMIAKRKLKDSLSRLDLEQLYLKKALTAALCYVVALVCTLVAVNLGREYAYNSTKQLSIVSTNEMDKYSKETIMKLDETYLANYASYNDKQLKALIRSYMPDLTDLQILDQVKRLEDKKKSVDKTYFRWWYVWCCFGVGLVGWNLPNVMLGMRKFLVKTEAEDDFLQLQTLVSIFMNTDLDTLEVLHQLSENSRIHKDMLLYCYHGYPSNPELELARLQAKTPLVEFKRFIGKLKLTISELSLREAFSDLMIEREHILKMREMSTMATINKKRAICGPLALAPLGLMVLSSLIVPLAILGWNEFQNALQMMG